MRLLILIIYFFTLNVSCRSNDPEIKQRITNDPENRKVRQIENNIDSLKRSALDGDLIVRMSDNIISYQVKALNEFDKSFSHSGIIITRDNIKLVCNIEPEEKGGDTVRFESIDSFINPKENLACGLFRYDLSDNEILSFTDELQKYHTNKIHFDMLYDLSTDNYIYCSEMIYKSLRKATHDRIVCRQSTIPKRMQPLMKLFFKKYNLPKNRIEKGKFITIDNLYLMKECHKIMTFPLKYFPGQ